MNKNKRISDYVNAEEFLNFYDNTVNKYPFLNSLLEHDKDEQETIIWEKIKLDDNVPYLILQYIGMMMNEIESTVNKYNKELTNYLCNLKIKINLEVEREEHEQE